MASPFQQQVRQRKFIYIGLILVLFTLSLMWRRGVTDELAKSLSIREDQRGEVDLIGSVVRLGLTGSRGIMICTLWNNAIDKQKKNQWNELEVLVRSLTKLQPHFITPWLFQSWNLAFNVSVESDRVRDKYFYIARGIELLGEGERQNRNHPDLRWSIGDYLQHKICKSDETNVQRSLFQLSLIPPNQRDPARFWKQVNDEPAFNWTEFVRFCQEHPQLVRRLRHGIHRDNTREKQRQFTCERPEDVVQFLEDNYNVPSLYPVPPLKAGAASSRVWDPTKKDSLLVPETRFPVLPPPHQGAYDDTALTHESELRDSTDGNAAAHAWFCFAQEPLPKPGPLPGNPQPIKDRARERKPRHMTTLIFRTYPAQGRRFMAERLQQEGWFDDEGYDLTEWLSEARDPSVVGKDIRVGGGTRWSMDAWVLAYNEWDRCGKENKLVFLDQAEEQNKNDLADRFWRRLGLPTGSSPPASIREEDLSPEELNEYQAAKYLFEYNFYRRVSNFPHHYERAFVEKLPETVACRKLFYQADQLNLSGSPQPALELYRTPINVPTVDAWKTTKRSPLDAWRDLVLLSNKAYRRDNFNQEQTAEILVRYLWLHNRYDGRVLKEEIAKASSVLPLVPRTTPDDFRLPIIKGPFNVADDDNVPLISEGVLEQVLERYNLVPRKPAPTPGPGGIDPSMVIPKPKDPSTTPVQPK